MINAKRKRPNRTELTTSTSNKYDLIAILRQTLLYKYGHILSLFSELSGSSVDINAYRYFIIGLAACMRL